MTNVCVSETLTIANIYNMFHVIDLKSLNPSLKYGPNRICLFTDVGQATPSLGRFEEICCRHCACY